MAKAKAKTSADTAANLGFEAKLWLTADKLRNNMDAAEYKHVVLGLIFLKYISDAFEERHQKLLAEVGEGADPEDPDEYRADNVFWVPAIALMQRRVHVSNATHTACNGIARLTSVLGVRFESRYLCHPFKQEYSVALPHLTSIAFIGRASNGIWLIRLSSRRERI